MDVQIVCISVAEAVAGRRGLVALLAVRVAVGVRAQEDAVPGHPGDAGAVQPAGAPRRRQVGAQLGHQIPRRLHVRRRRPHHRYASSTSLRTHDLPSCGLTLHGYE